MTPKELVRWAQLIQMIHDTIYAVWAIVDYTITYSLNGGTNGAGNPATFDVTDLPLVLADATKDSQYIWRLVH